MFLTALNRQNSNCWQALTYHEPAQHSDTLKHKQLHIPTQALFGTLREHQRSTCPFISYITLYSGWSQSGGIWTHLALGVCAVSHQAALQDSASTVQQGTELSLWEEPSQHFLPGPRAEPPAQTTQHTRLITTHDHYQCTEINLYLYYLCFRLLLYQSKVKLAGPWGRSRWLFCRTSSSSSRMDMEAEWAK